MDVRESIFRLDDSNHSASKKSNTKKRTAPEDVSPELLSWRRQRAAKGQLTRQANIKAKVEEDLKIVHVGVDFGTTYSGVAWITGNEGAKGDAEVITQWGRGNGIVEKVPSRIAYAHENANSIRDGHNKFGYELSAKMTSYAWFKLGLDNVAEPTEFDDPLIHASVGRGLMQCASQRTYEDMTADFLEYLYNRTLAIISGKIGREALSLTAFVFHITLPASWSHKARDATRAAAIKAGFGSRPQDKIVLTDEPEAAIICSIMTNAASFKERSVVKEGSCLTVVDIGGGTCDLVSYKVVKTSPLQLHEACVGAGAKSGGTMIDRNLHRLMADRFDIAFTQLEDRLKGPGSSFMDHFEGIKRDFNLDQADDDETCFSLPLKMSKLEKDTKGYDFDDDTVQLTSKELKDMFDDALRPTFELVEKQVQGVKNAKMGAVKAIILCGGMGSSPYVEQKFKKYAEAQFEHQVEIISPNRPWSAIARGAALSGLGKPAVLHRICRSFIGIPVNHSFDDSKHTEEESFIDEVTGQKYAANQMKWVIRRGDPIKPSTKATITCFVDIPLKGHGKLIYTQNLYTCPTDDAPQRLSDDNVTKIGEMSIDLSKVATDLRRKARSVKTEKGQPAVKSIEIAIDFKITPHTDKGVLLVIAMHGNRVIGEAKVEYEADPTYECRRLGMVKKQFKARKIREESD